MNGRLQCGRRAPAAPLRPEPGADHLATACGQPGTEDEALADLLSAGSGIQIGRDGDGRRFCINGRHRTTAMLDAGVRRTIVLTFEMPGTGETSN